MYYINFVTIEVKHRLAYVVLSKAKKLSQIALLSSITGTRMDILNNNSKTELCIQHKVELLRTIQSTKERLNVIIGKT